ncbi:hypothetical protein EGW08_001905 [Elysia chlorotica]|uniref:Uncharacterized protein n=1 Tax=Elysia chlorotica TaxID=188477 RepID=A0A433U919_ELYCH|nr:hypothetical protein EGW08_001905 [Elysia chlorotica]
MGQTVLKRPGCGALQLYPTAKLMQHKLDKHEMVIEKFLSLDQPAIHVQCIYFCGQSRVRWKRVAVVLCSKGIKKLKLKACDTGVCNAMFLLNQILPHHTGHITLGSLESKPHGHDLVTLWSPRRLSDDPTAPPYVHVMSKFCHITQGSLESKPHGHDLVTLWSPRRLSDDPTAPRYVQVMSTLCPGTLHMGAQLSPTCGSSPADLQYSVSPEPLALPLPAVDNQDPLKTLGLPAAFVSAWSIGDFRLALTP